MYKDKYFLNVEKNKGKGKICGNVNLMKMKKVYKTVFF